MVINKLAVLSMRVVKQILILMSIISLFHVSMSRVIDFYSICFPDHSPIRKELWSSLKPAILTSGQNLELGPQVAL